jgi:glutamate-5-semialdehyde dehydrogenase
VLNAKVQRPAVCNSAETLLIDEACAPELLPKLAAALIDCGVEIRGCTKTCELLQKVGLPVVAATEEDWATEYSDLIMACRVVADYKQAVEHINKYNTRHSECIVTENAEAARYFQAMVDAAAVYVNASTRFTDGVQFGFGAEIGISTQKLHARGPMGLIAMTSYKYLINGQGQVRP